MRVDHVDGRRCTGSEILFGGEVRRSHCEEADAMYRHKYKFRRAGDAK